jgi:hypothetical protein
VRAYLRLDPQLADMKSSYPDGAFRAFVEVLCFAEQQPTRGVFRHRKLLAVLLDKRARWIQYLLDQGDLVLMATGQLVVEGWQEWQEGDWKVHERIARIRNRERRPVTPSTVTEDTVATVTSDTPHRYSGGGKRNSGRQIAEAGAPRPHLVKVNGEWREAS